jgi:hypothetical protein
MGFLALVVPPFLTDGVRYVVTVGVPLISVDVGMVIGSMEN